MGLVNKVTKKISGVEKSRLAEQDSDTRELLRQYAFVEDDIELQERYNSCADCPILKEEFKLFGITIKDRTPVCGECGCNLLLKIPMKDMECPNGLW